MKDLKPCPRCGKMPVTYKSWTDYDPIGPHTLRYALYCATPGCPTFMAENHLSLDSAIAAWELQFDREE